jgi:hypothetical protein
VVERVQCEIADAVRENLPNNPWLKTWAGGFALTLKVETVAGITGTANWVIPWTPTSTFGIGASAGISGDMTRTAVVKFMLPLDQFTQYTCLQPDNGGIDGRIFVSNLGLSDWLRRAIQSGDRIDVPNQPTELDYTLNFAVALNGGVTPGITLVNLSASTNPTASGTYTHTLDLAFTDASPSNPQKVFVVNWPGTVAGLARAVPGQRLQLMPRTYRVVPGTFPYRGTGSHGIDPDVKRRLDQILDNLQLRAILR